MTRLLLALPPAWARTLAADLELEGVDVIGTLSPHELDAAALADADAVLLRADRDTLHSALVRTCDRSGVRILTLGSVERDGRLTRRLGLGDPFPEDADARLLAAALRTSAPPVTDPEPGPRGRIISVWGPAGSPGRTTLSIQLAALLAAGHRQVTLIDADSRAPGIGLLLGLSEDAPGLAAACRRADQGALDQHELSRIAVPVETSNGRIDVLTGLNRPSRWPELSAGRLRRTYAVCREWADDIVVDVSADMDDDGALLHDLPAPGRNDATLATLQESCHIVAMLAADPLGVARFLRDYPELRAAVGDTPVTVVANRVRPGPLGIDARGQIRRTLDRYADIEDVVFLPEDGRSMDAALLHAKPPSDITPRAPFVVAVRRLSDALRRSATDAEQPALRAQRRRGAWRRRSTSPGRHVETV